MAYKCKIFEVVSLTFHRHYTHVYKICLHIRRKYSFSVLINRKTIKHRQAFSITNSMASLDPWPNGILNKINSYHR